MVKISEQAGRQFELVVVVADDRPASAGDSWRQLAALASRCTVLDMRSERGEIGFNGEIVECGAADWAGELDRILVSSKARYFAVISANTEMPPEWLERGAEALDDSDDVLVTGGLRADRKRYRKPWAEDDLLAVFGNFSKLEFAVRLRGSHGVCLDALMLDRERMTAGMEFARMVSAGGRVAVMEVRRRLERGIQKTIEKSGGGMSFDPRLNVGFCLDVFPSIAQLEWCAHRSGRVMMEEKVAKDGRLRCLKGVWKDIRRIARDRGKYFFKTDAMRYPNRVALRCRALGRLGGVGAYLGLAKSGEAMPGVVEAAMVARMEGIGKEPSGNRVLIFFPQCFWPPSNGAHSRFCEMLRAYAELGFQIHVASACLDEKRYPWSGAKISELKRLFVKEVYLFRHPLPIGQPATGRAWGRRLGWEAAKLWQGLCVGMRRLAFLGSNVVRWREFPDGLEVPRFRHTCTDAQRFWFSEVVRRVKPDVVQLPYVDWEPLLNEVGAGGGDPLRVLDCNDFVDLNRRMQDAIKRGIGGYGEAPPAADSEVLDEAFFERKRLEVDRSELELYDRFDHAFSINPVEDRKIREATRKCAVHYLPVTIPVSQGQSEMEAKALLAVGPNFFNLQGLYYFCQRVHPLLIERCKDFELLVTGQNITCVEEMEKGRKVERRYPMPRLEKVSYLGFVDSLEPVYAKVRMAICPVFGGTGQQIKIVEAMAHGLPVVALEAPAKASPLIDGVNGLVVKDAAGFADAMARLFQDAGLARSLGEAARETVAREFTTERIVRQLVVVAGRHD